MNKWLQRFLLFGIAPFALYYVMLFGFVAFMGSIDAHVKQNCINSMVLNGATQEYAEQEC